MPQPVKISDGLLEEARRAGDVMQRSINGQIEHWAQLGRCLERVLNGQQLHTLRAAAPPPTLSYLLSTVNKPEGRARLQAVLDARPFPHYNAVPGDPRAMEREDEDGTKVIGRFINRKFVPISQ